MIYTEFYIASKYRKTGKILEGEPDWFPLSEVSVGELDQIVKDYCSVFPNLEFWIEYR